VQGANGIPIRAYADEKREKEKQQAAQFVPVSQFHVHLHLNDRSLQLSETHKKNIKSKCSHLILSCQSLYCLVESRTLNLDKARKVLGVQIGNSVPKILLNPLKFLRLGPFAHASSKILMISFETPFGASTPTKPAIVRSYPCSLNVVGLGISETFLYLKCQEFWPSLL